jgi:Fibronectin type III domain
MLVLRIPKSAFTKVIILVLMINLLMACGGGSGGSSSAGAPAVSASAVTLTWNPPMTRKDGSPLAPGEIGGYRLYYGTTEGNYIYSIDINDGTAESATVTDLTAGKYYFVITTYDTEGRESDFSPVLAQTI